MLLVYHTSLSVGYLISSLAASPQTANAIGLPVGVIFFLFAGSGTSLFGQTIEQGRLFCTVYFTLLYCFPCTGWVRMNAMLKFVPQVWNFHHWSRLNSNSSWIFPINFECTVYQFVKKVHNQSTFMFSITQHLTRNYHETIICNRFHYCSSSC